MTDAKSILKALGSRPIAYHPAIAKALGSVNAALVVCQLMYWDGKGALDDGWIVKTNEEFTDELGMSEHELETARRKCKEAGVLKYERKGMPGRGHYLINLDALLDALMASISQAESASLVSGKPADTQGGKRLTSQAGHKGDMSGGKRLTSTESTAESTAERENAPDRRDHDHGAVSSPSPLWSDPRVSAYTERFKRTPTKTNAEIIRERVSSEHIELWRETLRVWAASGWNKNNIAGICERYESQVLALEAKRETKSSKSKRPYHWVEVNGESVRVYDEVPA
jgi:hypothetical protein